MKQKLIQTVLIHIAGFIPVIILYITDVITAPMVTAALYAAVLTLVDSSAVHFAVDYSIKKSNQTFYIVALGGTLLSMFVTLIAILILLIFLNIDKYAFILVFFIFYVFTMVHKIYHFNKLKT
ncbi:MAG: hypothetical protein SCALA702_07000 [Melioribacteraceae bacterium]|nr:MAG: hypothetical protein SCALA702_07000 [Melioribacteraceae bacterium]